MKTLRYPDHKPARKGDTFNAPRWGTCRITRFDRLNACAIARNTQTGETFDMLGQDTFSESDLLFRKQPKPPKFHNANGTITMYSFACGYVERYGASDYPRATICREPNDWHVKGFTADQAHFWEIFETVKEARTFARSIAGKLTLKKSTV